MMEILERLRDAARGNDVFVSPGQAADEIEKLQRRIAELEDKMQQILAWDPTIATAPRRRIAEIRDIAATALAGGKKDG